MLIKNYSDTDFVVRYRGEVKTLKSQDVTYIDEKWISFPMLHSMFGNYIGKVEGEAPLEEFLFDNQIKVVSEQVYTVKKIGPGTPRVFIKGGNATLYFAEGIKPESIKEMAPSAVYTNVTGLVMLPDVTVYMAVKADKGTSVIFTNIQAV